VLGGTGSDTGAHRIEWRIVRADSPAAAEQRAQLFNQPVVALSVPPGPATGDLPAGGTLVSIEGAGILSALKPAGRGEGFILRALLIPGPVTVRLSPTLAAGRKIVATDAMERDKEELGAATEPLQLTRERFGAIATVRIR
jgi:hypothetical protein